jgi:lipoprotein-anchoring transpeptidase ErfK/SrfK
MWGIGPLVLFIALGLLAAGGAGSAYAAYRYDRATATHIMPGVSIEGVDVGNMTRHEALQAVSSAVDRMLGRDITVKAGDRTWRYSLRQLGLSASVSPAVDKALAVSGTFSWVARVYHRLAHHSVNRSFSVSVAYDGAAVKNLVRDAAKGVVVPAQDAGISLEGEQNLIFTHAKQGRVLRIFAAEKRLRAAVLAHRAATIRFPITTQEPKVTDATLGKTIVVNRTTNTLQLYDGFQVIRKYGVATAMPGFLTNPGTWHVIAKVENPTWHNPCLGQPGCWAAGEPAEIPPGPGNPLGTRALYLDAPGIRIHGTPSDSSIGTWASHGCIRMHISESEALYPLVPVGTKVLIMGAPPWGDSVPSQPAGT